MSDGTDFLLRLVERFPRLARDYEDHVADNGVPLPHAFFGELTGAVVQAYAGTSYQDLDWRAVIGFLEEAYPSAPLEVKQIVVSSFLMNLPWPEEAGYGVVRDLGPVLAESFAQVRPAG